jgi:hypothetical protein
VKCYDRNDDSRVVFCRDNVCSYYSSSNEKSSYLCGTTKLDIDAYQIQIKLKITPTTNKNCLLAYVYACNKNKYNTDEIAFGD